MNSLNHVLQAIDEGHRAEGNEDDEQQQGDHEQDFDCFAPENHRNGDDQDCDCLDVARSGRAAVKCEHVFTLSLLQSRPGVALVAWHPSDQDRDV